MLSRFVPLDSLGAAKGEKKLPLWKAAEELFGHLQPQHVAWDPTAGFVEGHVVPIDATLFYRLSTSFEGKNPVTFPGIPAAIVEFMCCST